MNYNAKATPVEGKNFPVVVGVEEYWVSRSVALCALILVQDEYDNWYVVAEKRGAGCPDENFKWCLPCGYIERNGETGEEGISREVFEETGLKIKPESFHMTGVSYGIEPRYNITHFYESVLEDMKVEDVINMFDTSNSEPEEIEELKCIRLDEVDKYEWAFDHRNLIEKSFILPTIFQHHD